MLKPEQTVRLVGSQKKNCVAFPWPGGFTVVCVFYDGNSRRLNRKGVGNRLEPVSTQPFIY